MTKCDDVQEKDLLHRYLRMSLEEAELEAFDLHIESCPDCEGELALLVEGTLQGPALRDSLDLAHRAARQRPVPVWARWRSWFAVTTLVAATALALFIIVPGLTADPAIEYREVEGLQLKVLVLSQVSGQLSPVPLGPSGQVTVRSGDAIQLEVGTLRTEPTRIVVVHRIREQRVPTRLVDDLASAGTPLTTPAVRIREAATLEIWVFPGSQPGDELDAEDAQSTAIQVELAP
jgi:hypothetical protein